VQQLTVDGTNSANLHVYVILTTGCFVYACADPVIKILLLDETSQSMSSSDYDQQLVEHAASLFSPSSIRAVENHPCRIRCIAFGGYPPPSIEVHVGQRVVTSEFAFRNVAYLRPSPAHASAAVPVAAAVRPEDGVQHVVNGVGGGVGSRGLRAIDYQSERWTTNFLARAEDDEALMKCVSVVPGMKPAVAVVKLHVDCKLQQEANAYRSMGARRATSAQGISIAQFSSVLKARA
jgi:hypothetical protein